MDSTANFTVDLKVLFALKLFCLDTFRYSLYMYKNLLFLTVIFSVILCLLLLLLVSRGAHILNTDTTTHTNYPKYLQRDERRSWYRWEIVCELKNNIDIVLTRFWVIWVRIVCGFDRENRVLKFWTLSWELMKILQQSAIAVDEITLDSSFLVIESGGFSCFLETTEEISLQPNTP